jgi:hypothetical protein
VLHRLRNLSMNRTYEKEPEWRTRGRELVSGYQKRW